MVHGQVDTVSPLEAGRCRFNCRTEKENWIAGYRWAAIVADPTMRDTGESLDMEAEVQYREYKQEARRTNRREGIKTTHKDSKSRDIY